MSRLANVVRKPLVQIFRDFRGVVEGTPVANEEWDEMTEATFEQLCSGGRDGRLRPHELHAALLRLGVPASISDAESLTHEWTTPPPARGEGGARASGSGTSQSASSADGEPQTAEGLTLPQFQALTRSLLFPRSVSGDVKYHLGLVRRRELHGGRSLELELMPNPSHLEAINPLVAGRARAVQLALGGASERRRCMPRESESDEPSRESPWGDALRALPALRAPYALLALRCCLRSILCRVRT